MTAMPCTSQYPGNFLNLWEKQTEGWDLGQVLLKSLGAAPRAEAEARGQGRDWEQAIG